MVPQPEQHEKEPALRLFIAVPAPPETKVAAEKFRLQNVPLSGTRWVYEENFHVTLLFLGDVPAAMVPQISENLHSILDTMKPLQILFDRFSLEGVKKPSMVWARYQKNILFTQLAGTLREKLSSFAPGISRFAEPVPHITLARIRTGPVPDLNGAAALPGILIKGFELWQTLRVKDGVRYESLEVFHFKNQ